MGDFTSLPLSCDSSPHIHRPFSFAPPGENASSMEQWALESSITEEGEDSCVTSHVSTNGKRLVAHLREVLSEYSCSIVIV